MKRDQTSIYWALLISNRFSNAESIYYIQLGIMRFLIQKISIYVRIILEDRQTNCKTLWNEPLVEPNILNWKYIYYT